MNRLIDKPVLFTEMRKNDTNKNCWTKKWTKMALQVPVVTPIRNETLPAVLPSLLPPPIYPFPLYPMMLVPTAGFQRTSYNFFVTNFNSRALSNLRIPSHFIIMVKRNRSMVQIVVSYAIIC